MNIKENRRMLVVLVGLIIMFLGLIFYLSYFTIFEAKEIVKHPANRRDAIKVAALKRGTIVDRNGEVLAQTEGEKYKYTRVYPHPRAYAHIVGYSSKTKGSSGLEASYSKQLLGIEGSGTLKSIRAFFNNKVDSDVGNDLTLTTSTKIQQYIRDKLAESGEKGAAVVMNPKTGEILGMVSYPDFNIQNIDSDYSAIVERNNGAFFNNAIQGGYAPGSIFKIISTAAIIESGIDQKYKDTGEEEILGRAIKNAGGKEYGDLNLNKAFTHSVNTYFANKVAEVGKDKFVEVAERFMMNKKVDFDLNTKTTYLAKSSFNSSNWDQHALASAGIGQADILTTPLEMCMVASAIANEGKMMAPYLVSNIKSPEGSNIFTREPQVLSEAVSPEVAKQIGDMMVNVVRSGSGKTAKIRRAQVAGKTGTAQISKDADKYNAWFVGYAPAKDPEVAVAVIIQNVEKFGGEIAAPIAGDIINYSLGVLD